ncbi:MAG: sugar ABC transporter permease [Chloroflexota bacterium]|nr:sugar ABC transporter permease [Chloroflexota bacterium]
MAVTTTEPLPVLPLAGLAARGLAQLKRLAFALIFLSPSIILFGVFIFYPLVKSVYLGFYETDPLGNQGDFVALDQYRTVLTSEDFRHALWITVLFTLYTVPPGIVLGLGLAMLANQKLPGISIFRTAFSSTVATSVAVASMMWLTLLNPSVGLINYFLQEADLPRIDWLNDPDWALLAVSLTTIWLNLGLATIVFLAGLQSIPERLYESARIDGAGRWATFLHVTLPMLSPTLLFVTVVGTILAFESFGQIHILTRGGPLDATTVIVYSIWQEAFQRFDYGVAAVQAVGLFILVLGLTGLQIRFLERRVFYQ